MMVELFMGTNVEKIFMFSNDNFVKTKIKNAQESTIPLKGLFAM
jgi:hypothetical protein